AEGIKKIGGADIIFVGRQAIDGDTAQVGPQIALRLGLPVVTYVQDFKVESGKAIVQRQLEDGYEVVEVSLPCVLTAVKELNIPRYMTARGIVDSYQKEIVTWTHSDIGLLPRECGLSASPTKVFRSFTPDPKGKGIMLNGTIQEMADALVNSLNEKHLL
ncbi:MAG TPA: electron transfer flavoprotein subunit beta/FixA family protein, partial [Anaerovoracaceae bacterium]|nr:electron transfer flavoprotein subunit beta/FixA family protein [Anaerovoracaceae bacterium]